MSRAVVIGAGPAGTVAAIFLARRGIDVTLVEQHRFPRDKVCGECLSAMGIDVLERVGLGNEVKTVAVQLTASAMYGPAGECAQLSLPSPMWGISRARLDNLLILHALRCGAKLVQPARCEGIEGKQSRIRDLSNNNLFAIAADWFFVADGKGSLFAEKKAATGDFGIKAHFAGVSAPTGTIGLYALNGHYVGVAPVEGGLWNIAFSAPLAKVRRFERDFDGLLREAMHENAALGAHLRSAKRAGEWLAAPLPRFGVARSWPANVIPIGNAAAAIEPIGGEGMGLAMRSAELAVEQVDRQGALRGDYSRLWELRRTACRFAGVVMSHPFVSGAAVELVAGNESLARQAMALLGKA